MIVHNMSFLMPVVYSNHLYEVANHLDCATIVILLQKSRPRANILKKALGKNSLTKTWRKKISVEYVFVEKSIKDAAIKIQPENLCHPHFQSCLFRNVKILN